MQQFLEFGLALPQGRLGFVDPRLLVGVVQLSQQLTGLYSIPLVDINRLENPDQADCELDLLRIGFNTSSRRDLAWARPGVICRNLRRRPQRREDRHTARDQRSAD